MRVSEGLLFGASDFARPALPFDLTMQSSSCRPQQEQTAGMASMYGFQLGVGGLDLVEVSGVVPVSLFVCGGGGLAHVVVEVSGVRVPADKLRSQ